MGYETAEATAALRFSLGHSTTVDDIDWTAIVVEQVLARLGVGNSEPAIAGVAGRSIG